MGKRGGSGGGGGLSFVFQNASPFVEDKFCLLKNSAGALGFGKKGFYYIIPNAHV